MSAENGRYSSPKPIIPSDEFGVTLVYEVRLDAAVARRLTARLEVSDTGCWEWRGAVDQGGYGCITIGGRLIRTHRATWMLAHGRPIPDGFQIDHLCRNRACCNPEHLEAVTSAENTRRSPLWPGHRTECAVGHPLSDDNVYLRSDNGGRRCRTCSKARANAWRQSA